MLKDPVNTAFDTYRIVRMIGEGGSGAVYQAQNTAGEHVAIKCLKPKLPASKRKRFQNEILFCQRSEHPNIVRVLDSGAALVKGEPLSFYVMPYYPATLRSIMAKRIKPDEVLPLFSQLLDGVEAAHLQAIHHRDLKPENILFDDRSSAVVVADFGAADFTEDEMYTLVETQQGERIGNFQYAAPEQRSRGSSADHRADIYALGLILNEMYTGQVPTGTGHDLIASISYQYAYLDDFVERMRRQSPESRPQSIREIKAQILARGNEFIEFQRLDALKRTVVSETVPDDPSFNNPVQVLDVEYGGDHLIFTLGPTPSAAWISVFTNPQSNYNTVAGHGPQSVQFLNNKAVLPDMQPHEVKVIGPQFKEWVNSANRTLPGVLKDRALKRDQTERNRIRREVFEEEQKQAALGSARKALGLS